MTLSEYTTEIFKIRRESNDRIRAVARDFTSETPLAQVGRLLDLILLNEQTEIALLRARSDFKYR